MSKRLQLRRGTTQEHSSFVGSAGEVTVDTTKNTAVVHDGVTPGGHPLAAEGATGGSSVDKIGAVGYHDGTRILTVQGDRILCDGKPIRDIGVTSYQLTPKYVNEDDMGFIRELELMSEQGIRFLRIGVGCWWASQWEDNFFSGPEARNEWVRKLKVFLDVAYNCGIGVVYSVFWKHQDMADVAGETITEAYTPGSLAYTNAETILNFLVPALKDHPGLAGWEVGNEYSLIPANEALPHVDVAHGTRASYNAPEDVMTSEMMRDFHSWFSTKVQSLDDTGRMIMSGNGGPAGVVEKTIENYLDNWLCQDNPAPMTTVSIHKYSRNDFGHRAYDDLRDTLVQIRRKVKENAAEQGIDQAFVLGEFGSELNDYYGGFGNLEVVRTACEAIERSGVQLAFAWDWERHDNMDLTNDFSFHPHNKANGTDAKWQIIKDCIERLRAEPESYIDPFELRLDAPSHRGGSGAVVSEGAAPTLMTTPAAPAYYYDTGFSVSFWLYVDETPNYERVIMSNFTNTNEGWYVGVTKEMEPFVQVWWSNGSQTNTRGSLPPMPKEKGWHFLSFQVETDTANSNYGLTVFYDGRWNKTFNIDNKTWTPPATTPFALFAHNKVETDGSLSIYYAKPGKVGFKDVTFHNRSLNDRELRYEYMYTEAPTGTVSRKFPLDGGFAAKDGSATLTVAQHNGTSVGPQPTFVEFPK